MGEVYGGSGALFGRDRGVSEKLSRNVRRTGDAIPDRSGLLGAAADGTSGESFQRMRIRKIRTIR